MSRKKFINIYLFIKKYINMSSFLFYTCKNEFQSFHVVRLKEHSVRPLFNFICKILITLRRFVP